MCVFMHFGSTSSAFERNRVSMTCFGLVPENIDNHCNPILCGFIWFYEISRFGKRYKHFGILVMVLVL